MYVYYLDTGRNFAILFTPTIAIDLDGVARYPSEAYWMVPGTVNPDE